jgi:hypothetical protein
MGASSSCPSAHAILSTPATDFYNSDEYEQTFVKMEAPTTGSIAAQLVELKPKVGLAQEEETDRAESLAAKGTVRHGKHPRESSPKVIVSTKRKCTEKADNSTLYLDLRLVQKDIRSFLMAKSVRPGAT